MATFVELGVWALITGGTPLILASVPFLRTRFSDQASHLMLGLSAGILGGLVIFDILPESFEAAADQGLPPQVVPIAIGAGFFFLLLIERHLIGASKRGQGHFEDGRRIQPFGTLAMSALTVHGTIDGFVIPLAFELGGSVGTVIVLAVALHQVPDSFAALAVGLSTQADRRTALTYVLITAIDTPIGILLGVLFLGAGTQWLPLGLGFSAGTFLFVSAADLIPELQHRSRSLLVTASIVVGFLVVLGLSFLPGV